MAVRFANRGVHTAPSMKIGQWLSFADVHRTGLDPSCCLAIWVARTSENPIFVCLATWPSAILIKAMVAVDGWFPSAFLRRAASSFSTWSEAKGSSTWPDVDAIADLFDSYGFIIARPYMSTALTSLCSLDEETCFGFATRLHLALRPLPRPDEKLAGLVRDRKALFAW